MCAKGGSSTRACSRGATSAPGGSPSTWPQSRPRPSTSCPSLATAHTVHALATAWVHLGCTRLTEARALCVPQVFGVGEDLEGVSLRLTQCTHSHCILRTLLPEARALCVLQVRVAWAGPLVGRFRRLDNERERESKPRPLLLLSCNTKGRTFESPSGSRSPSRRRPPRASCRARACTR